MPDITRRHALGAAAALAATVGAPLTAAVADDHGGHATLMTPRPSTRSTGAAGYRATRPTAAVTITAPGTPCSSTGPSCT